MMTIPDNQPVLVKWRTEGARMIRGVAHPRAPGDEDVMPWGDVKGVVAIGRCKLVSTSPQIPVIGDVHAGDEVREPDPDE